ncbi:hypothetical protein PZB75_01730 [Streptomyces sp. AM 4-1-1]|uniref:hypothetical protein n=1 Tax=Streptomyces sp. AM 4-1-1 TaxID=3028710 RepID=UPI0023B8E35E|nr:hypothetical protein [Streptomyces sp. AM 4-1-1]WEH32208.1 hypothetical protein PZB75_01730 [Streptomyces sp. AM 4-1-1]
MEIRTELDQSQGMARGCQGIDRSHVIRHVSFCRVDRIIGTRQIHDTAALWRLPGDPLMNDVVFCDELRVETVALVAGPPQYRFERLFVQRSADFYALTDVVLRALRIQQLRIPDALLRCG